MDELIREKERILQAREKEALIDRMFPEKAGAIRRAHLTNSDMRGVVPVWDADLYPDA